MRHVFIVNPVAGGKDVTEKVKTTAEKMLDSSQYQILRTEYPGHATALAKQIAEEAEEREEKVRIYACGGDGTLNEVLCGMWRCKGVELAAYPCGTGNDFVRAFGDHKHHFSHLCNLIEGEGQLIDLITVNERPCINIASVGLDSAVAEKVHRYSDIPFLRKYAYQISLAVCFFTSLRNRYLVEIDGRTKRTGDFIFVAAAGGRFYGGGFMAAPEANLCDGVIDLVTVDTISRRKILPLIGIYKNGRHIKEGKSLYPAMIHLDHCTEILIKAEKPLSVNIDGEIISMKDPLISLRKKALHLAVPKEALQADCLVAEKEEGLPNIPVVLA